MKYPRDIKYKGYLIESLMYQQNDGGFMVLFIVSKDGVQITEEKFTSVSKAKKFISEEIKYNFYKNFAIEKEYRGIKYTVFSELDSNGKAVFYCRVGEKRFKTLQEMKVYVDTHTNMSNKTTTHTFTFESERGDIHDIEEVKYNYNPVRILKSSSIIMCAIVLLLSFIQVAVRTTQTVSTTIGSITENTLEPEFKTYDATKLTGETVKATMYRNKDKDVAIIVNDGTDLIYNGAELYGKVEYSKEDCNYTSKLRDPIYDLGMDLESVRHIGRYYSHLIKNESGEVIGFYFTYTK